MTVSPSPRELLLLRAALSSDPEIVAASWQDWSSQIPLEIAPYSELRLLPAVRANLGRVASSIKLPDKLLGKAKATFTRGYTLALTTLPVIDELKQHCPVMLIKGLAMCARFDAWASRPMADVDIQVPSEALDGALEILARSGWTPQHGMTWGSLRHRSSLRRDSWNFTRGVGEVDLHWRLGMGRVDHDLGQQMWETSNSIAFGRRTLTVQSSEFALVTTLHHGLLMGDHTDTLQTLVDAAWLLPRCNADVVASLLRETNLQEPFMDLAECFRSIGVTDGSEVLDRLEEVAAMSRTKGRQAPQKPTGVPAETTLLRRPALYWWWTALGRKAKIERALLRLAGPCSKPLVPAQPRAEYDLRDCGVLDEIGGPGWAWPEPDRSHFWTDRADARLLIPLPALDDYTIVIGFAERASRNAHIDIFANGLHVGSKRIMSSLTDSACCLLIPRRALFGPWVELSIRPKPYNPVQADFVSTFGAPVRRIRVLDSHHMAQVFSGHEVPKLYPRLVRGEEPYASKLARIEAKIENSPHKTSRALPEDFDPLLYVLSYPDLFEVEVDPYEHFLSYGRHEGRVWR